MSLCQLDWEKMLEPESPMPPDVWFVVRDSQYGSVFKFPAHRYLLCCISAPLKAHLSQVQMEGQEGQYGDDGGKEEDISGSKNEIIVENATVRGFSNFLKFCYCKPEVFEEIVKKSSFSDLLEVAFLATRYDVPAINDIISEKPISKSNLIEVAKLAANRMDTDSFGDLPQKLLQKCANLLPSFIGNFDLLKEFQTGFEESDHDLFGRLVQMANMEKVKASTTVAVKIPGGWVNF